MSDTYDPAAVATALNRQGASNALNDVSSVPPQAAATALQAQRSTGYPASAGMFDPASAAAALKKQQNQDALANPTVARWTATAHPAHIAAAQDDLGGFAKISQSIQDFVSAPYRALWEQAKAGAAPPTSFLDALQAPIKALGVFTSAAMTFAEGPFAPLTAFAQRSIERTPHGPLIEKDLLTALGGLGAVGEIALPEAAGAAVEAGLKPGPGEFGTASEAAQSVRKAGPAPEGTRWDVARTQTGYVLRPVPLEPSIGVPPQGVSPEVDSVRAATANLDAAAVKSVEEAVAESPVATRSPETMRDFLESQPGIQEHTAYLNPADVVDMLGQGKITVQDFGDLIGKEDNAQEAFWNAHDAKADFAIPLSDYLTATNGKTWADELRESTRFSTDGVSQDAAKELWQEKQEPPEPEHIFVPPPLAHDPALSASENEALKIQEPSLQLAAKQATQQIYLKGAFADAKALGMNAADMAAWSTKVQAAQQAIYEKLVARAKKQIKEFQTPKWKATYRKHYDEVSKDFYGRPGVVVYNQLQSSATEALDLAKDNALVANDKPITFYRATPYHHTGDGEVPMDLFLNPRPVQSPHPYWRQTIEMSAYRGASLSENPEFAGGWKGGLAEYQSELKDANGNIVQHEKRPVVWITHVKTKKLADFRNSEDVEKAFEWYKKKNPQKDYEDDYQYEHRLAEEKRALKQGLWAHWERPEMLSDLDWDAVRMVEHEGQTPPNLFVVKPDAIYWKYDAGAVPTKIRLALSNRGLVSKELLDRLPRGIWDKDGEPVDSYAEQLGYASGEQMLQELATIEDSRGKASFKDWLERNVKAESSERAKDELGWDLSPVGILDLARGMVDAPEVEDLLLSSLKAMREELIRSGTPPEQVRLSKQDLQNRAKQLFEAMPVKDATNIQAFERAIRDNSRKVEQGLLRGNSEKLLEAFKNRQAQLLNYFMLKEAHSFLKIYAATTRNWQRLARRATSKRIDQSFLNHVQVILSGMGLKVRRQLQELQDSLNGFTTEQFLDGLRASMMDPPQTDMPTKSPQDMTVQEFRDVREMVNGLKGLGEKIHLALAKGQAARLADIEQEVSQNATLLGRRYPLDKILKDRDNFFSTMVGRAGKVSRVIGAYNIRPETYLFYLDRDKFGPLMKYVVQTLADGRYLEDDLHKAIMKDLEAFYKTQPKGWLGSMNQQVDIPELQHRGIQWIRTRGRAIATALNLGTEENFNKLATGFGWNRGIIEAALNRALRPEDWAFVQKIWDIHENTLWPKIVETYRDKTVSGVPPRRKTSRSVPTPGGELSGGYAGIHYDQAELERMGLKDPSLRNPSEILGGEYRSAAPSNNYTKAVTGFSAPLDLSFDLIPARIAQIIHDIAWRRPLIQANKVLNQPKVVAAMQETLGPEFPRLNRNWLEYIAREAVYPGSGGDAPAQAVRAIRSNFMAVQVLFRVSTMALHTPTAAIHMLGEGGNIGKAAVDIYGRALADIFRTPGQISYWYNFIDERSGELRNIEYGIDRDVRDAILRSEKDHGPLSVVKSLGFGIFSFSKKVEARVTWLARYRQIMDKTNDEAQAIALANKSVRDTQGAGSVMDLPPILRGGHDLMGELGKTSATLFMGFRNTFANREWRIAVGIRRVLEGGGTNEDWNIVRWILTFVILSASWYKFEQENYGGRKTSFVESLAHQTIGSLPLGDLGIDMVTAGLSGKNPLEGERASPEAQITGAFTDDLLLAMGKPVKQPVRSAIDSLGYAGLPFPDQLAIAAQYAFDVSTGRAAPASTGEAIHGFLTGNRGTARRSLSRTLR